MQKLVRCHQDLKLVAAVSRSTVGTGEDDIEMEIEMKMEILVLVASGLLNEHFVLIWLGAAERLCCPPLDNPEIEGKALGLLVGIPCGTSCISGFKLW